LLEHALVVAAALAGAQGLPRVARVIPVLGIPILSRPDDLTAMLASVDEPVGRLVIIDNGA
jgi:hypothetical protein